MVGIIYHPHPVHRNRAIPELTKIKRPCRHGHAENHQKSSFLFLLLTMAIICQCSCKLELRKSFKCGAAVVMQQLFRKPRYQLMYLVILDMYVLN